MASQPPPKTADILVRRDAASPHIVADMGYCTFLGVDFELLLIAAAPYLRKLPVTDQGRVMEVEPIPEYVEAARVRLNPLSARHVATNLLFALMSAGAIAPDEMAAEIEQMAAFVKSTADSDTDVESTGTAE